MKEQQVMLYNEDKYKFLIVLDLRWQRTPASLEWLQSEVCESYTQSISLASLPLHCTSSKYILPVPEPKLLLVKATESTKKISSHFSFPLSSHPVSTNCFQSILVACTQHCCLVCPSNHSRQYPIHYSYTLQLFLRMQQNHQLISTVHQNMELH